MSRRTCKGTKKDGTACGALEKLIDPETGFCPAHGPGAAERMAERGRKGARATAKKFHGDGTGLEPGELGPLERHEDAKRWLRILGEAVATGRLGHKETTAAIRAVDGWIKAEGENVAARDLQELREQLERLESGGPKVRAIK